MLTWSLGWASSPARLAITSLAFMFEEVPEPVWKTSTGNWSSCSPSRDLVARLGDPLGDVRVELPSSALARAAAALSRPSQWITGARHRLPGDLEVLDRLARSRRPRALGLPSALGGPYLARLEARAVALAEGALELGGQQAVRAEAGGGVEPADEVGVDAAPTPRSTAPTR